MIKISVLYPNGDGHVFDMNYYLARHIPLVRRLSGAALKRLRSRREWLAWPPVRPPAYLAIGHLFFESVQAFQAAFGAHASEITGDIPNYTNTQPTIQISQVKLF
jgi:uncharacterized protein (TIGR02118 family)